MFKRDAFGAGLAAVVVLAAGVAGCGATTLVECQLSAVRALPLHDPDAITVRDARELAERIAACEPESGDAGVR